jgi:hypothetical protein
MEKFVKSTGRDPYLVNPNDYNPGFFGHLNALVEAINAIQSGGGGGGGGLSSILVSQGALTIPATGITITGSGATLSSVGDVAFLNIPATRGPQGVQGPVGPQGPAGTQGAQGVTGINGAVGPQGPQGPQGLTGPQGIQGVIGPAGANGVNGNKYRTTSVTPFVPGLGLKTFVVADADLAYSAGQFVVIADTSGRQMTGTVTNYTLSPNNLEVNVTAFSGSGSSSNWQINLQGIQGPTGLQGLTGPQGPQGIQGIQGLKGDTGSQGVTGTTGTTGPAGPQGPQGLTGAAGADGAKWYNVTSNPNGTSGPAGSAIGDFALLNLIGNALHGQTFQKTAATTWTQTANILGPQGIQGNAGTAGSAATVVAFTADGYGVPIAGSNVTLLRVVVPFNVSYDALSVVSDVPGGVASAVVMNVIKTTGVTSTTIFTATLGSTGAAIVTLSGGTLVPNDVLTFVIASTNASNNATKLFVSMSGTRS